MVRLGRQVSHLPDQADERFDRRRLRVAFKHDFDDATVVEARLTMTWIAPNLFRVDVAGATVGNGYVFEQMCHYHMKFGDKFVEVSYVTSGDGVDVFGSSSSNAEGHYIAWKETLRGTAS